MVCQATIDAATKRRRPRKVGITILNSICAGFLEEGVLLARRPHPGCRDGQHRGGGLFWGWMDEALLQDFAAADELREAELWRLYRHVGQGNDATAVTILGS